MAIQATDSETVAGEVLALLAKRRLDRVWLAQATGIPYTTLARRFRDPSGLTIDEVSTFASALGVSMRDLYPEEGTA